MAIKPRVGVFKFASCDGCQLSLLDAEDELLAVAGAIDIVHAYEEALEILRDYRPIGVPRVTYSHVAGEGTAATEAPRGTLYHRYNVDDQGKIEMARIIPPTSQNQAQIEEHMRRWVPHILSADEQETAQKCENLVRSYDPCISCSTHFLKVKIDRTT